MLINLSETNSISNQFIAELRDAQIQNDSLRFRTNLERLGEIFAYEISKKLTYKTKEVTTPLGIASVALITDKIVLATILRAGLAMHNGMLNYMDKAESAFIGAERIIHPEKGLMSQISHVTAPSLDRKILIISDPMMATGDSILRSVKALEEFGKPKKIYIASIVASTYAIDLIRRRLPKAELWLGAIDEELTAKAYIVPGIGDVGDLAYGNKFKY